MPHPKGKKGEGRALILASAGRGFRSRGYGGLGVDGLARDANVTSGAFYAHFDSKADAFQAAVAAGLEDLDAGIAKLRAALGDGWREGFIDFYLGDRRTCDLAESRALQSLTDEVARSNDDTRAEYERQFLRVLGTAASGMAADSEAARRADAIALFAMLIGGVPMARAVRDPRLADEIAAAVRWAAIGVVEHDNP